MIGKSFSMERKKIIQQCYELIAAYKNGLLGECIMPEESAPAFSVDQQECRLAYFTLPMALNYQRDSYKLWEAALKAYSDIITRDIFNVAMVAAMPRELLQEKLLKYKVALQPNKHVNTWLQICHTIHTQWGSLEKMLASCDSDFLQLRETIQKKFKKGFPYLSGPKIFNYWNCILSTYGQVPLKNKQCIDIAPDTHVIQCSVKLGILSQQEGEQLPREEISLKWRELLTDSSIYPADMHSPLWFWSRSGFQYQLTN